jgi:hypothetical protein
LIEVYAGSSTKVNVTTYFNGEPTEPVEAPQAVVKDASTNTILLVDYAEQTDDEYVGEYELLLPANVTAIERILKIEWEYQIGEEYFNSTEYIYVTIPYLTVDEIILELGFSPYPEGANYQPFEKIHAAARTARMIINNYLGFSLTENTNPVVAYGTNADVLSLPHRIIEFKKLYENDQLIIDIDEDINNWGVELEITETNNALRVIASTAGEDIQESERSFILDINPAKFKDGYRYKVEGTFGYQVLPLEVKQAMLLIVNDLLCNDSIWRSKYVKKMNTGQMSVELSSLAFAGTGNAIADAILQKFKMIQLVII